MQDIARLRSQDLESPCTGCEAACRCRSGPAAEGAGVRSCLQIFCQCMSVRSFAVEAAAEAASRAAEAEEVLECLGILCRIGSRHSVVAKGTFQSDTWMVVCKGKRRVRLQLSCVPWKLAKLQREGGSPSKLKSL